MGWINVPHNLWKIAGVISLNDAFIALIIEFAFSAFLCALATRLERLIHDYAKAALVAYTSETFSNKLILRVTVLRLLRMQPKEDTLIFQRCL